MIITFLFSFAACAYASFKTASADGACCACTAIEKVETNKISKYFFMTAGYIAGTKIR